MSTHPAAVAWKARNKQRIREYNARYRRENREKVAGIEKAYRDANRGKIAARQKAHYETIKEHRAALKIQWRLKNQARFLAKKAAYRKANVGKILAANAARRAARMRAIPAWANRFYIDEIYDLATMRTAALGVSHHVDHIVPLKSDRVCGLHCEANLQVIPAIHNLTKHNRVWPDMPTETV